MVLLLRRVPLLHHCPCSERLESRTASVVGDGVWDMLAARRACALGIGLLSGGYAKRSWSAQAPIACMKIRPIS
jgi:phosphoglycolate phosphatase-like HAD superfamily hydrolase